MEMLDLREQLIVRLALFSGMRPGEILALQWKHVAEDHVQVVHRVYRGKLDQPRTLETHGGLVLEHPPVDRSMAPPTGRLGRSGGLGVSFGKDHDTVRTG